VDPESFSIAQENVKRNHLDVLIQVRKVQRGTIFKGVIDDDDRFDFTMCNPPFFSSEEESCQNPHTV